MDKLLGQLTKRLPDVSFEAGDAFFWSPRISKITYKLDDSAASQWALLHEAAHAVLGHKSYKLDIDLLLLEVSAWQTAESLAQELSLSIDPDHIQDCLDTYRDWLHQRSSCPRCGTVSLQASPREYICYNCNAHWAVTASRFCRPYRLSGNQTKSRLGAIPQATFQ